MKESLYIVSDKTSILFNLLIIIFFIIIFRKKNKFIPVIIFISYLLFLFNIKLTSIEAFNFNKIFASTLLIIFLSQKERNTFNLKYTKIIFYILILLFIPYIGIIYSYNQSHYTKLVYSFSLLSFILFYGKLEIKNKKILILSIFLITLFALAKWLIIYYLKSIHYLVDGQKSAIRKIILAISIITVTYVTLSLSLKYNDYISFDQFILSRVTKSESVNYEQNFVMGISDGNRFNIAINQFDDYIKGNIWTGLGLGYQNINLVPEHNIFLFYITRFGLLGVFYTFCFLFYFFRFFNNITQKYIILILHILLTFSVGEYYGISISIFTIVLLLYSLLNVHPISSKSSKYDLRDKRIAYKQEKFSPYSIK